MRVTKPLERRIAAGVERVGFPRGAQETARKEEEKKAEESNNKWSLRKKMNLIMECAKGFEKSGFTLR